MNSRTTYLAPGVFNIISIMFSLCVTTESGGAVFVDNYGISMEIESCSFHDCKATSSDSRGGAIVAISSTIVSLKYLCFAQCFGTWGSSYVCWISKIDHLIDIYSSEVGGVSNQHGPCPASQISLEFKNNNLSRTKSLIYCGGFFFLSAPHSSLFLFSQVCDSDTASFISLFVSAPSITYQYWNMINNTILTGSMNGGWVQLHGQNTNVLLQNMIFIQNNMINKILSWHGSSASLRLTDCIISNDINSQFFSNCIMDSCVTQNSITYHQLYIYQTFLCKGSYYTLYSSYIRKDIYFALLFLQI